MGAGRDSVTWFRKLFAELIVKDSVEGNSVK
jgi:hypothetical protein